jgi:thiamine-phosphate pyrophosphorylase
LRAKTWEIHQIEAAAHLLAHGLKKYGTCFIINDHVEVAVSCGAHGVHLGQDDGDIRAARTLLGPDKLIGRSTHSLTQIETVNGADYIGFGPIFRTQTKRTENPLLGINTLTQAVDASTVPVVAIGGITRELLPKIRSTGVHAWAVIKDIAEAENIREAVKALHPYT